MAPRKLNLGPKAQAVREWIDVLAYGGGKVAKGLVPLALGSIAGAEVFAPSLFPVVEMSRDVALLFLGASAASLVPGLRLTGGSSNG